jgi:hypothetical protein
VFKSEKFDFKTYKKEKILEMLIMSARERDRAHMSALMDFYFMSALT